jgi:hypothetical protein
MYILENAKNPLKHTPYMFTCGIINVVGTVGT